MGVEDDGDRCSCWLDDERCYCSDPSDDGLCYCVPDCHCCTMEGEHPLKEYSVSD